MPKQPMSDEQPSNPQPSNPQPSNPQPNNPLHGLTLEKIVTQLEAHYGWDGLASRININCFKSEPSIKSSLKFLRKTPWARDKVEDLYISTFSDTSPWDKFK